MGQDGAGRGTGTRLVHRPKVYVFAPKFCVAQWCVLLTCYGPWLSWCRIVASLKTEAGRKKILICVKDVIQLHGNPGNSEVVGVAECHKLVAEFEKLKKQGDAKPAESSPGTSEKDQTVKEEQEQDENAVGAAQKSEDDDDDLAIEMPGESKSDTYNFMSVVTTDSAHREHFNSSR